MNTIATFLTAAKLARKQYYKNLTLFPLLAPNAAKPDYLTLEQALEGNRVQISELDQDGSVPELRLINKGAQKVLIVEGEELVGAKQNRIVNATFLVAAGSKTVIPVSCVEQGRWRYDSNQFDSGNKMMHASLRRNHQTRIRESLKQGRGYQSNQGEIWENISAKLDRMKVSAPTRAMADAYDSYADKLSDYSEKFQIIDCQIGAVFAIDGQVLGLESFGCSDTFGRFFEKIVKSYALDALDSRKSRKSKSATPEAARRFIQSASKGKTERHPTLGMGEAITIESRVVSGATLTEQNRVIHLSAFRKIKDDSSRGVNYRRYSERYRRRQTN